MKTLTILGIAAVAAASITPASALVVDLTTAGSSGTVNGALFQQVSPQTTGTGVIDPFLRVQGNDVETGLNTSLSDVLGETKTGIWTHDLLLSAVPIVNVGGVDYYQFLLDINQNKVGDNELLSLTKLELWTKSGALTEANSHDDLTAQGAVKQWDLDGVEDSTIELNFILNPGSGAGDMFAYIPVGALGTDGSLNLYLYTEFGLPGHASNDGIEEWAVLTPAGVGGGVPDAGSTTALLGMSLLGLGALRRKLS